MNKEIKTISQCVRELVVTVEADQARSDYSGILRSLRPIAMVPGFRKGKAPLAMIESMYGEHAREEFYRQKVEEYFKEASADLDPAPVNMPEALDIQWEKGEELVATFRYEVRPEIEELTYKDIEIAYEPQQLPDEAVEKTIEDIRKKMGTLEEIDEAAAEGDHVNISLQLPKEGGEWSDAVDREIVVGENQFSATFNTEIVGKKVGDVFECSLFEAQGEDDSSPVGRVEVKLVKRNNMPDLDDEFAKDVEYESMDDMRAKVREELQQNLDSENRRAEKDAITTALISANEFDVPPSLVHQVAHNMAEQFAQQYRMPVEQILPAYEKIAERDLKQYYIVDKLKQLEEQTVTDDDKTAMIEELAANMNMTAEEYKDKYAKFVESDDFTDAIIEKKLYALIRDAGKFVKPEAPKEAE